MRRMVVNLACVLANWLLASGLAAPAAEQVQQHGGTVVRAELDRDAIELSGSVVLTISVEGKAPLEIEPSKAVTASKAWLSTPLGPAETANLPKERMRWRQAFRLSPLQDKEVPLPLEPLRCRAAGGEFVQAVWKPFTVKVSTVVANASLTGLKDITPPEQIPEPPPWPLWPFILLGALLAGVAGWIVFARLRRRRSAPPAVELSADAWALQELGRLEALAPAGATGVERYHTLLSDVVRRYLERRFGIHASEQTSAEFLAALTQAGQLPEAQLADLRAFIDRCDLAKYARADYSVEECRTAVQLARAFVKHTAKASIPEAAAPITVGEPAA